MNNNLTELVFILDKSGSMAGKQEDVVGGFNSTIDEQKENDTLVSTVLFSNDETMIHDRVDIKEINHLSLADYKVGGCTALIDAIGNNIKHIEKVHKYIREEDTPNKVLFVISTDGLENASVKFSSEDVKKMIKQKQEIGWEFLFLGANIDSVETAKMYGIKEDRAVNYHNDKVGISMQYKAVSNFAKAYSRGESTESGEWRKEADDDYKSRKNRS